MGKVALLWSPEFAYAIGLLTADGCLSKDGRHIDLTSKDAEQIELFETCLGIKTKISPKYSGAGNLAYHTQFGDVLFYQFLMGIGLTPAKSNTISSVLVPKKYFFDFFRGYFDGDGSSYSRYDSCYKKSYRFNISFTSGSEKYLCWLRAELSKLINVKGYLCLNRNTPHIQLKYSKNEAVVICKKMYYKEGLPCLKRKYEKIAQSLEVIEASRSGETGRRAAFRAQ